MEKVKLKIEKLKAKLHHLLQSLQFLTLVSYLYWEHFIENMSLFRQEKLAKNLRSFAKRVIFLKFFMKWKSLTKSNPTPHIQKQTFFKDDIIK